MKSIVCVKDTAAMVFGQPFVVQHVAQAVRSLRDEVNSKESSSDVAKHPDDFDLYELASFDEDTGIVSVEGFPKFVVRVKDLRLPE
nr:MAG: nonstructural protein [Microvirus sp.]